MDSCATGGKSDGDMVGDKFTGLSESDMAGLDVISGPALSSVVSSTSECLALVISLDTGLEPLVTMTGGYCVTFPANVTSDGTVVFAE